MADDLAFPKIPKPEYPEVERKPLSKFDFATLFLEQGGRCKKCGAKLERGKVRDEHLDALHLGGGNELSNRELWCLDCTKPKDRADKKLIAKGKRIKGETGQLKRLREKGPVLKSRNTFLSFSDDRVTRKPDAWQRPADYVSALSKRHKNYRKQQWGKR